MKILSELIIVTTEWKRGILFPNGLAKWRLFSVTTFFYYLQSNKYIIFFMTDFFFFAHFFDHYV